MSMHSAHDRVLRSHVSSSAELPWRSRYGSSGGICLRCPRSPRAQLNNARTRTGISMMWQSHCSPSIRTLQWILRRAWLNWRLKQYHNSLPLSLRSWSSLSRMSVSTWTTSTRGSLPQPDMMKSLARLRVHMQLMPWRGSISGRAQDAARPWSTWSSWASVACV